MIMTIGYIGLGKMGKNMVLHLLEQGVEVIAYNRSPEPLEEVEAAGAIRASSIENLVEKLKTSGTKQPTVIWLMLKAGSVIDEHIAKLTPLLQAKDLIIDGGNSFYKDTIRRAQQLAEKEIHFMDVAVSGGPNGARTGACLMIGGAVEDFSHMEPLIQKIAAPTAYAHLGAAGAGHFAKMVHNGIEYGMMQAIAEGAAVLEASDFDYDLSKVFAIYNNQSVIESKLVGWTQGVFAKNPTLADVSSAIGMLGEGEWTVDTAKQLDIPVPIIEGSVEVRRQSVKEPENFRNKVVTALRGAFGGHHTKVGNVDRAE
jgi:6-phosphogluconate dehydrogenase